MIWRWVLGFTLRLGTSIAWFVLSLDEMHAHRVFSVCLCAICDVLYVLHIHLIEQRRSKLQPNGRLGFDHWAAKPGMKIGFPLAKGRASSIDTGGKSIPLAQLLALLPRVPLANRKPLGGNNAPTAVQYALRFGKRDRRDAIARRAKTGLQVSLAKISPA